MRGNLGRTALGSYENPFIGSVALIAMYEERSARGIPDYAFAKHTTRGRQKHRGWKHFWTEGAKLMPLADVPDTYAAGAREIRHDIQSTFEGFE